MRPGIVTWNPVLKTALASGAAPLPLMEVFWGLGQSRTVIAGVRLGVFEALAKGPADAAAVAETIDCAPEATRTLLNALTGFGYLRRKGGRYRLAGKTRKWLLAESSGSLVEMMRFLDDLFRGIEPLEEAIRTGEIENYHHQQRSPEAWRDYVRGLGNVAAKIGGVVVGRVPVDRPPERLLDVGGGHGMFSVAFCRRYPEARATVLDLPETVEHGRELVEEAGQGDRVTFRAGDLRTAEWGEGYDVVFLFNILHNLAAEECRDAIGSARRALRPGGTLAIVDSQHEGGEGSVSAVAGFNELFFLLVSGAQAWPEERIRGWLDEAGFGGVRRGGIIPFPGLLVLSARAPE